jgi:hypothetical protein
MSTASELFDVFQITTGHPAAGVVTVVDELLLFCQQQALRLEWRDGRCMVHLLPNGAIAQLPVRRSVVRGILARLATLCNERNPGVVSPYGGQTRISFGDTLPALLDVSFTNTPDEQWLHLEPVSDGRRNA